MSQTAVGQGLPRAGSALARARVGPRSQAHPLLRWLMWRAVAAVPVAAAVSVLTFLAVNALPGGTAQALLGRQATPGGLQALTVKLHLDQPLVARYWHWVSGLVQGQLGSSLASGQPVSSVLRAKLPASIELLLLSLLVSLSIAVPVALLAARRPGSLFDRFSMAAAALSFSAPPFVVGLFLVIIFGVHLGWLPAIGFVPATQSMGANLRSVALPVATIALPLVGSYSRVLRGDLVDQMRGAGYVRAVIANGASPSRILWRYALRNSLYNLVTLAGLNLALLIGAMITVEQVFDVPGIGSSLLQAVNDRDAPVVEAIVLLLSLWILAANAATDLCYRLLDPRVRLVHQ